MILESTPCFRNDSENEECVFIVEFGSAVAEAPSLSHQSFQNDSQP